MSINLHFHTNKYFAKVEMTASPFSVPSNAKSIFGGETSHTDSDMDGWADFISSENANISGIKLFENMIPYVDQLLFNWKIPFFLVRMKSVIRNKNTRGYISINLLHLLWFRLVCFENGSVQEINVELWTNGIQCFIETIRFNGILCISLSIFDFSIEMQWSLSSPKIFTIRLYDFASHPIFPSFSEFHSTIESEYVYVWGYFAFLIFNAYSNTNKYNIL